MLLSMVFQSYHGDSSHYSCLSWVSPVLGLGSEVTCPRTLPRKHPEDPVRLEPRAPGLRVKHFTTEPRRTPLWEKEKLLVMSNFSFPTMFWKLSVVDVSKWNEYLWSIALIETNILTNFLVHWAINVAYRVPTRYSCNLTKWPSLWSQMTEIITHSRFYHDKQSE